MISPPDPDLTPIPEGFREITWEIGTAELQESVMAVETFEALRAGKANVKNIRTLICRKRKLIEHRSAGNWTETAGDRFINEHAWVLATMNDFDMISKVDSRTRETSLLPGAEERLAAVVEFFQRNEPFEWRPGPYKKARSW